MKVAKVDRFEGLRLVQGKLIEDERGVFLKTFNENTFASIGLETHFQERYYSKSRKNVVRGMHFQTPPFDHVKVVNVLNGTILDVVLDVRKKSPTFGQYFSVELNDHNGQFLYIPKGFAHGFKSLTENTIVEYNQTTEYNSVSDCGILWNSFGFDWKIDNPIISNRDQTFQTFDDYISPF
jgi:dTDP-4-dehydrorhamnose 3,5-epimerase/CDP-3, 6-dideoxy-D-glycero-D-glycero-4-hexulose-5-epimerase